MSALLDNMNGGMSKEERDHILRPRTIIVDFNHLAYKYAHGMKVPLVTYLTMPDGTTKPVTTNIQNGTGKVFNRWARGGTDRLAVCFDRPTPTKKAYIAKLFGFEDGSGYKSNRSGGMGNEMFEAIEMTQSLLMQAGVTCYAGVEYEADDLIMACIEAAKRDFPGEPIDIVTGDLDLVPLVDDQVSVFLSSRTGTYAEHKFMEKTKYQQVTPENYEEVMRFKTAMKSFDPLYNTVLLIKMLRGDDSDNIPGSGSRFFVPKKVKEIVNSLESMGVDIANTFRYGGDLDLMTTVLAPFVLEGDVFEAYANAHGEHGTALNSMLFDEWGKIDTSLLGIAEGDIVGGKDGFGGLSDLGHTRKTYRAMNLNTDIAVGEKTRKAARLAMAPGHYDEAAYMKSFASIGINISPA